MTGRIKELYNAMPHAFIEIHPEDAKSMNVYSGDRVRVSAQLIDGNTGQSVWADRFDRALVDIFESLSAEDRPYKPAMSQELVLHILQEEAEMNHLILKDEPLNFQVNSNQP